MSDTTSIDQGDDYQTNVEMQQAQPDAPPPAASTPVPTPALPSGLTGDPQQLMAQLQQLQAARQQAEADHAAYYDPTRPRADDASQGALSFGDEKPAVQHGALHDFGNRLWASTLQVGEAAEGAMSFAARNLGADRESVAFIEAQKQDVANHIQATLDDLSPKGKEALQASIFSPGGDAATGAPSISDAGWGRWASGVVADAIPQVVMAALPGGIAVQVGKAAAFGALDAGGAYNEIIRGIDNASQAEMGKSPVYAHLREQGMSDINARKELVAQIAPAMVAAHFAVGTAAGAGLGATVAGKLVPQGASLVTRALIGAGEGAATMGGQAAGDNAVDQKTAAQTQGATFDPSQVALEAAKGALGGAVLGGAAGAFHGGGHTATPDSPTIAPESPTEAAASQPVENVAATPALTPSPVSAELHAAITEALPKTDATPSAATSAAPTPASTPVQPTAAPAAKSDTTGLSGIGSGMAGGISDSLRDHLWTLFQKGSTTEAGMPSNILMAAKANAAQITDRASFDDFYKAYGDQLKARQAAAPTPAPAPASTPAPTPVPAPAPAAPAKPLTKAVMLEQMKAAGAPMKGMAALPVDQLRVFHADALRPAAEAQQAQALAIPNPQVPASTPPELAAKPAAPQDLAPTPQTVPPTDPGVRADAGATPPPVEGSPAAGGETPVAEPAATTVGSPAPVETPAAAPTSSPVDEPQAAQPPRESAASVATTPDVSTAPLSKAEQIKADLRARRAAQKAKLAPPGERVKGAVASSDGEAPEPATAAAPEPPVAPTRTKADAMADLSTAMQANGAKTIKRLSKGPEIAKVLSQAMREISSMVDPKDDRASAVTDAIEKWSKPTVIPGTSTKRVEVGDALMRMMTGKAVGAARMEQGAREARVEAQSQASVHEREGAANKADLEASHARDVDRENPTASQTAEEGTTPEPGVSIEGDEASQGVTDYGGEKTRSEDTTDRQRIANDHLQKVLEGTRTPQDAANAFDHRGGPGRPPREELRTFAGFLDAKIEKLERDLADPKIQQAQLKRLIDTQGDSALRRDVMREMKETSPDRLAELKAARAELRDPVRAAVVREKAAREPKVADRFGDAAKAAKSRADDLREQLAQAMARETDARRQQPDESDAAYKARKTTDAFFGGSDKAVDGLREQLSAAEREAYRTSAVVRGNGFAVLSQRAKDRAAGRLERATFDPEASRYVQASNDHALAGIISDRINSHTGLHQPPEKLHDLLDLVSNHRAAGPDFAPLRALSRRLREVAPNVDVLSPDHAADLGYTSKDPQNNDFSGYYQPAGADYDSHIVLSSVGHPDTAVTLLHEALHATTSSYISTLEKVASGHRDLKALDLMRNELMEQLNGGGMEGESDADLDRADYATMNRHEMHTMMMSEPALQALMKRTPVSARFRAEMAKLGFNPQAPGRSVWRHFTDWTRRALGLGPADSASGASLFDHVMGPGTELVDNAAKFNRAMAAAPEEVRALARPMFNATTVGDRTRDVARYVDLGGISDKLRRGALQGSTTDAITKWNSDLFRPSDRLALQGGNPLLRFRAAQEAIAATTKRIFSSMGDRVTSLAEKLTGRTDLGQLMNDATIARVRLGSDDPTANDHLTDPDEKAALAELERRYAALSPADQATYKAVRDHYQATYDTERAAQRQALVNQALPDATPAQIAELTKVTRTEKGIKTFLDDPDSGPLAAAFGDQWQKNRQLVRGIAKIQRLGFVTGDYFPLRRYGDYVVSYGDKNDASSYGVEHFERKSDADARRNELLRQNVDGLSQVLDKRASKLREVMPEHPLVNELSDAMKSRPDLRDKAAEVNDLVNSILLEHASRSEAARTRARRKGIAGASNDAARTLASEYLGHATRMGYLEHGAARGKALADMRLVADDLGRNGRAGEQIRAQAVTNELEQRVAAQVAAQSGVGALARRASNLGFIQSLMSPSHMITSSIEAHTNSAALLGARHGAVQAGAALTRALADVSPQLLRTGFASSMKAMGKGLRQADWDLSKAARDRFVARGADAAQMDALFKAASDAGLVDHSATRDLRAMAQPGIASTTVGKYWGRFLDMNAAGAHAVDVANRSAILKAAYDLELRKTGSQAAAIARAVDTLRDAVPNYNIGNKARIATNKGVLGEFAAPLTQFKQYGIHMYGVMGNLLRSSINGTDPATRREARKAFAGILATHAIMAGALTVIADPLRLVGGIYDFFTGAATTHDYQNDVRGFLSDTFGPELGEIIARGAPHAVGIDIHRRVGLANLLELPDLDSFDSKGLLKAIGTMATGAAGEDAATMAQGIHKVMGGDITGGLQDLVPRVLRDPMKALDHAENGIAGPHGTAGLPASSIGVGDTLAQAVGFQPSAVSEYREGRAAVQEAMQEAKTTRAALVNAWLTSGDDRSSAMSAIRQFNEANPGEAIQMPQLVKALRDRAKPQPAGVFGLRLPPRGAAMLAQAGRFATTGG